MSIVKTMRHRFKQERKRKCHNVFPMCREIEIRYTYVQSHSNTMKYILFNTVVINTSFE